MNVLMFVDDSPYWHAAGALVARLARETNGSVTALATAWLAMHRKRALAEARRIFDLPEGKLKLIERPGLVEYVLPEVAAEEKPALVVMGRLGSLDRLTSGLVAQLLVRRTPGSVLLARGKLETVRRILVCTQGPRHGGANLERALDLARALGARLTVIHVASQMGITERAREELDALRRDFMASGAPEAEHLRALSGRLRDAGVEGGVKVRFGLVVEEILAEAHEGGYDLLVVGAHDPVGRGEGFLYEDLSGMLVRAAHISTLVVRDAVRQGGVGERHAPPAD